MSFYPLPGLLRILTDVHAPCTGKNPTYGWYKKSANGGPFQNMKIHTQIVINNSEACKFKWNQQQTLTNIHTHYYTLNFIRDKEKK